MIKEKIKAVVVLGPTSSGKSDLAIHLAKKFNGEVISADSRQIFLNMNLGTGKVDGEWTLNSNHEKKVFISEKIPHHIIDFLPPTEKYNVANFQKDCLEKIDEIAKRKKLPIICGGSSFWIDAVVDGIILPKVQPNKKLREELEKLSTEKIFEKLKNLDPKRAENIDKNNKLRLIRAIEICKKLGRVPKIKKVDNSKFDFLEIGLSWDREILAEKIQKRLESRWLDGMIKEVSLLKKKYDLTWQDIQDFGLAYFWIPEFLQEKISLEELKEKVYFAEKNYAKRQMTWLKRNNKINWLTDYGVAEKLAGGFLK